MVVHGLTSLVYPSTTPWGNHARGQNLMALGYRKFMRLLESWADHKVPQMLGTVVSLVAICLGVSMFLNPSVFISTEAFSVVFAFASPYAWGTVYIMAAFAVLVTVYTHQKSAQAPVFMLGATFAAQALLQIPQIANGSVPSGLYMYMGLGWVCFITQLICGARDHEKAPVSY